MESLPRPSQGMKSSRPGQLMQPPTPTAGSAMYSTSRRPGAATPGTARFATASGTSPLPSKTNVSSYGQSSMRSPVPTCASHVSSWGSRAPLIGNVLSYLHRQAHLGNSLPCHRLHRRPARRRSAPSSSPTSLCVPAKARGSMLLMRTLRNRRTALPTSPCQDARNGSTTLGKARAAEVRALRGNHPPQEARW